ncbi:MAG: guanitoxin biosynthesis PLP-dependent transaminase GntE [Anaerolineales bacterium]|nr:guanitoxin biosynthesis PLP-dependent transaminase GntE [Anaerolineales bacterium]
MNIAWQKNKALQQRAFKVMPLGVNSNFRFWGEGITPYVSKAKGAYLWDADGNRYIDYRLGFGPIILGHADETVNAKVREEIEYGTLAAMTGELEIEVAEKIVKMCPAVEMVRFACSGTEATMHALRVARAYTGREKVIKFEGMYHGFQDYTLWSTYAPVEAYGNARSPIPVPSSSGIPKLLNELIITLPFNDTEILEATLRNVGEQVAAIIVEPCMGNCGAILPVRGFLQLIRKLCDKYGIVFILDEVKTGFRIANGGAQEYYRIQPDLATYAKALANGYPLAAFGGRKEIMSIIGHGVAQGGTFNNNKPGVAAAWATLTVLEKEPVMKTIEKRGKRLMDGISKILTEASIPHCMNGYPAMFSYAIGVEKVTDQRSWDKSEKEYYLALVDALIERGVMPDHDPREPWFLCYSHTEADIDETLNVMVEVVK